MRALQIWVSRVTSSYSSIEITDLTTSFRNGLAFVGIIHHFRPDLITSPDKCDPEDIMGKRNFMLSLFSTTLRRWHGSGTWVNFASRSFYTAKDGC